MGGSSGRASGGSVGTAQSEPEATANVFAATGGSLSVAAGRLSFSLELTSSCLTVDTACCSTLAALHAGLTGLRLEECAGEAACGVGLLLDPVDAVAGSARQVAR